MLRYARPLSFTLIGLGVLALFLAIALLQPTSAVHAYGVTPTPTFTTTPTLTSTPTLTPTPATTPTPEIIVVDPVITKSSDPAEGAPGDDVLFTLWITNRGNTAAQDVVVTDEIEEYLDILDATTNYGTVTVEGQLVTVNIGTLDAGQTVIVLISARINDLAPPNTSIENLAILTSSNSETVTSNIVTVDVPGGLPVTGATRTWDMGLAIGLLIGGVLSLGAGLALWGRAAQK